MTTSVVTIMLMVDDDLNEHMRVKRLLPEGVPLVSAYSAVQGLDRCRRLVAEHPGALIILILDFRLPDMDGALLAAKLRQLLPEAPIIALSSLSESGPLMEISGVTRTLAKRLSDDELGRQIRAVIARPSAVSPNPVLAPYLAGHATTLSLLGAHRPGVAVLASSRPILQLLSEALHQAAISVAAQSASAPALEAILTTMPVQTLICDAPVWSRAATVARERQLPLLVVAMSLSAAVGLSIEPVSIVVAPEPSELSEALERTLAGNAYRDPRINAVYDVLELSAAERLILPYIVRDLPTERVVLDLNLSESGARKTRIRTLNRLKVGRAEEARVLIDELSIQ